MCVFDKLSSVACKVPSTERVLANALQALVTDKAVLEYKLEINESEFSSEEARKAAYLELDELDYEIEKVIQFMEGVRDDFKICSECHELMPDGYTIMDGLVYFCSDECLHKNLTPEEYSTLAEGELDEDDDYGESYYTEWFDDQSVWFGKDSDKLPESIYEFGTVEAFANFIKARRVPVTRAFGFIQDNHTYAILETAPSKVVEGEHTKHDVGGVTVYEIDKEERVITIETEDVRYTFKSLGNSLVETPLVETTN